MDYDSAWKMALDLYFRPFLRLLFPRIHDDINWRRPPEMLDKEFQKLVPQAEQGRQTVDKLVRVWRRGGQEAWVLVHVEVQASREGDFAERMYRYNTRIWERYGRNVASLAVLADDEPGWRPAGFERGLWDCTDRFAFPAVKLLGFAGHEEELQASDNPFARVVLAHLKTLQTKDDERERMDWKLRIAQGLHEGGFGAEDVRQLMLLLDWVMALPVDLERDFIREMDEYEEGRRMPYVTSWERRALEKAIMLQVQTRFGEEGAELGHGICELNDAEKYEAMIVAISKAATLDEVRRAYAEVAGEQGKTPGKKGRRAPKAKP